RPASTFAALRSASGKFFSVTSNPAWRMCLPHETQQPHEADFSTSSDPAAKAACETSASTATAETRRVDLNVMVSFLLTKENILHERGDRQDRDGDEDEAPEAHAPHHPAFHFIAGHGCLSYLMSVTVMRPLTRSAV